MLKKEKQSKINDKVKKATECIVFYQKFYYLSGKMKNVQKGINIKEM